MDCIWLTWDSHWCSKRDRNFPGIFSTGWTKALAFRDWIIPDNRSLGITLIWMRKSDVNQYLHRISPLSELLVRNVLKSLTFPSKIGREGCLQSIENLKLRFSNEAFRGFQFYGNKRRISKDGWLILRRQSILFPWIHWIYIKGQRCLWTFF